MRILKKLFALPLPAVLAVAASSGILVALTLSGVLQHPAIQYFSFLYSAYGLAVALYAVFTHKRRVGNPARRIEGLYQKYPLLRPLTILLMDPETRTELLLVPTLMINLAFGAFKLIAGALYGSWWFATVGMYYIAVAGMRFSLLKRFFRRGEDPSPEGDILAYRRTAAQILLLTAVLAGMFFQMAWMREHNRYPGVLIYGIALIAFVKISVAVSSLVRHRQDENLLIGAVRMISLMCALVSLLALQSAMIEQFGEEGMFMLLANTIFGTCIWLTLIILGVWMLIRAHRLRKAL